MSLKHTNFRITNFEHKIEKTMKFNKSRIYVTLPGEIVNALAPKEQIKLRRRAARLMLDQHHDFRAIRGTGLRWAPKGQFFTLMQEETSDIVVHLRVECELSSKSSASYLKNIQPSQAVLNAVAKADAELEETRRLDDTNCPELDALTSVVRMEDLVGDLRDTGTTIDDNFVMWRDGQPVGSVDVMDGCAFMLLNPVY